MEKIHPADRAANTHLDLQRRCAKDGRGETLFVVIGFLLLVFGLLVCHVAFPDKDYSKRENKTLAQFPEISLSSVFGKEGDEKGAEESLIGAYLEEQFPFRDQLMTLDALRQSILSLGKSNGVLLTPDGYLLPKEQAYPEETPLNYTLLLNTVKAYEKSPCFGGKYGTFFALAGKKSRFVSDLPFDYPTSILKENKKKTDSLLKDSGYKGLDLTETLLQYSDEQLYYRTDHHWTSLGAYYASAAILKEYGKESAPLSAFDRQTVTKSFRGTA